MKQVTIISVTLLTLGVVDVINTLTIIARGGVEINPIMDAYLQTGMANFIAVKISLMLFGVGILYYFQRENILLSLCGVYFILIIYQLILIINL